MPSTNSYAIIVLVALLAEYGVCLAADLLNLRALRPEQPAGRSPIYDPDTYRRSQSYARARMRFAILPKTVQLAVVIGFWFVGGFAALDDAAQSLGRGPTTAGLLFVGALVLAQGLLALPFDVYSTFVIEQRFGFNRTRPRTFVVDRLKGLLLLIVLGGPLLAGILWLFGRAGAMAWLYCWALVAAFIVVAQLVAPRWIMPLFLRFTPLEAGELRDAIASYARRVDFPFEEIFVVDGSRRSTKANAFFAGLGRRKRIALFDTLVEAHPVAEVVAVLAHEVGHYRRGHVTQRLLIGIVHVGVLFALLSLLVHEPGLYEAFGLRHTPVYAGLVFFGLLYAPVELALATAFNALSRRHEYQADRFGLKTTGRVDVLVSALERLATHNLANLTPHPLYVALHHSHPPLLQRIRALERLAAGP